jgi:pyruvate dehydrogenase E1 component alpha subunit
MKKHLITDGVFSESKLIEIEEEVTMTIEKAVKFALDSPFPKPEEALEDVYA